MLEHQHVQFEQIVQVPLVRSAGCTIAQPPAAQLGQQREEAWKLDAVTFLFQAERGRKVAANLEEIGYGS